MQRAKSVGALNYQMGEDRMFNPGKPRSQAFQLAFILLSLEES